MRSTPHAQPDLFEERATHPDLTSELRAKLTALLQSLLTEAAGLGQPDTVPHAHTEEDGDDQDHA